MLKLIRLHPRAYEKYTFRHTDLNFVSQALQINGQALEYVDTQIKGYEVFVGSY